MKDVFNQLPGYIAWKDNRHHYLGCNQNFANVHNLKHCEDILGLSDADFKCISDKELNFYRESDLKAISGEKFQVIHSIKTQNQTKLFHLQKRPLLANNNHIIGTFFHCSELIHNRWLTELMINDRRNQHSDLIIDHYVIEPNENTYKLSKRELECLFYLLRGMTAKKIAIILKLSNRTIEFYIDNIKNKFGCTSKSELIILAISKGYMKIIPKRFINNI